MQTHSLIRVKQVCSHYHIEDTFIKELQELGHIKLVVEQNDAFIMRDQLKILESMIYFYNELQINIEGIDAIANLLKQIRELQDELRVAKNKLSAFIRE